jgi:hypothetical protein
MSRTTDATRRDQLRAFRETTANIVGELRANAVRQSYFSMSLEELIDDAIIELDNPATDRTRRVGRLQRLDAAYNDLVNSIDAMKEIPPESFRSASPDTDVNTPPETED